MKYTYYPGCSGEHSSKMYDTSTRAVFDALGAELIDLDDWNCCGATSYMSVEEVLSFAISGRNLALAEKEGRDLITPCSGCYVTLNKTHHYYNEYPELREKLDEVLASVGLEYKGKQGVRHVLDPLVNDIGFEAIAARVKSPLKGLKVAPYYGCQIVRPFTDFDDPDDPQLMDELLKTLGATVVPYEFKTRCCGGAQMGTNQDLALEMVRMLLSCAEANGADMICTTCPLCQMNLEAFQKDINKRFGLKVSIPIVYFTQLTAAAFGLPENTILAKKHIVPFADKLAAVTA
ncbi:MAG TPA: CoB--CoM heterodisulfide reductase iron-sulfur subunit B family protein [Acidobacteriota bacterium]|nr:CoB--CoM heterodisulfide reductase iron-sulfur subunit B family protein [Acidobacteriota bacterium]